MNTLVVKAEDNTDLTTHENEEDGYTRVWWHLTADDKVFWG